MIAVVARLHGVIGRRGAPTRRRPSAGVTAAVLLCAFALIGLAGQGGGLAAALWQGALYLLPALLLLIPLLARRYPGEHLLGTLCLRRARPRNRSRAVTRAIELAAPHGGRLIAVSLAGRAPPQPWAAVPRLP